MRRYEAIPGKRDELPREENGEYAVTISPESVSPRIRSPVEVSQNHIFRPEEEAKRSTEHNNEFILRPHVNNKSNNYKRRFQKENNPVTENFATDQRSLQMEGDLEKIQVGNDNLYQDSPRMHKIDDNRHSQRVTQHFDEKLQVQQTPQHFDAQHSRIDVKSSASQRKFNRIPLVAVFKARIAELEKELDDAKSSLTEEKELSKTLVEELDNAINEMKNETIEIEKDLRLSRAEVKHQKRMIHSIHADYKFQIDQLQKDLDLAQEKAATAVSQTEIVKKELLVTQKGHNESIRSILKDAADLMMEMKELKDSVGPSPKTKRDRWSRLWFIISFLAVGIVLLQLFQHPVNAQTDLIQLLEDFGIKDVSSQLGSFLLDRIEFNIESLSEENLVVDTQPSTKPEFFLDDIESENLEKMKEQSISSTLTGLTEEQLLEVFLELSKSYGSHRIIRVREDHEEIQNTDKQAISKGQHQETNYIDEEIASENIADQLTDVPLKTGKEVDEFVDEISVANANMVDISIDNFINETLEIHDNVTENTTDHTELGYNPLGNDKYDDGQGHDTTKEKERSGKRKRKKKQKSKEKRWWHFLFFFKK